MSGDVAPTRHVPGWPDLTGDRMGDPEVIRWITVEPDGELVTHESVNAMSRAEGFGGVWLQWRLMRDVAGTICPPGQNTLRALTFIHSATGVLVSPMAGDGLAVNRTATVMARGLADVADDLPSLLGTVAWLGEHDAYGWHVDMPPGRVQALIEHAAVAVYG